MTVNAELPSVTDGELTKRLEGVVARLMRWCDCGGEGCDLCHSAKAVTAAALEIVTLAREKSRAWNIANGRSDEILRLEREVAELKKPKFCIHCLGSVEPNGKCKNDNCIGAEFSYENPDGWPK